MSLASSGDGLSKVRAAESKGAPTQPKGQGLLLAALESPKGSHTPLLSPRAPGTQIPQSPRSICDSSPGRRKGTRLPDKETVWVQLPASHRATLLLPLLTSLIMKTLNFRVHFTSECSVGDIKECPVGRGHPGDDSLSHTVKISISMVSL